MAIGANVAEKEELDDMVKRIVNEWGTIDVLVNNAGERCVYPCPN